METKSSFVIAIYFGENTEYMCWNNETSSLLENALHYESKMEAEIELKEAKEFATAKGWVNSELAILEIQE